MMQHLNMELVILECRVSPAKYLILRDRGDVWWWTPLGIPSSFIAALLLREMEKEDWV